MAMAMAMEVETEEETEEREGRESVGDEGPKTRGGDTRLMDVRREMELVDVVGEEGIDMVAGLE